MGVSKNVLVIVGAVLAILGVIGLAIPVFTTEETKEVAKIGDLKVEATEETTYAIPPLAAGGVLVVGLLLIGAGYMRR